MLASDERECTDGRAELAEGNRVGSELLQNERCNGLFEGRIVARVKRCLGEEWEHGLLHPKCRRIDHNVDMDQNHGDDHFLPQQK